MRERIRIADYIAFDEPAALPAGATNRLLVACEAAREFAASRLNESTETIVTEGNEWAERFLDRPNEDAGATPWNQFYRAAFWFICGAVLQQESPADIRVAYLGACMQQELTRSLPRLSLLARRWIWDLFLDVPEMALEWRKQAAGATAVARVACCAHSLGKPVALPSVEIDFFYKIDLIIQLTAESARLVCVQVKHTKMERPSIERVYLRRTRRNDPSEAAGNHLRRNFKEFGRRFDVDWTPVFIEASGEGLPISDLEPLPLLRAGLQELLNRLQDEMGDRLLTT